MRAIASSFSGRILPALACLVAAAALPAIAYAAEVSVHEESGEPHLVTLQFQAGLSENNHLAITYEPQGNGYWQLDLVDGGAGIIAGAGCTGGGVPGAVAHCRIHEPKGPEIESCGRDCLTQIPGTAWSDSFQINLGNGDNSFDGHSFTGTYGAGVAMEVSSGSGADLIITGNAADAIDPGAGSDEVHSNNGEDKVFATPEPDGPDLYDAGTSLDRLSYARRITPVELHESTAGSPGEGDVLVGGFNLVSGSGDDILVGGPHDWVLDGGPGADVISADAPSSELYGGPGDDSLDTLRAAPESVNHLVGEEGNDAYRGGPGTDIIREQEAHSLGPPEAPPVSSGDDVAYGGAGGDVIELRAGRDAAYGEDGGDMLHGGGQGDVLSGGAGPDLLIGGAGFDRLRGGAGSDVLFSSHWRWHPLHPHSKGFPFPAVGDDGPDRVSCGRGRDSAFSNPWDHLSDCEQVHLRPQPKSGKGAP